MIPSREAVNLLEELGIDSLLISPKKICAQLDIEYQENPLKEIDGVLLVDEALNAMVCVNSSIVENGRKIFTGAHELGHYCLDSFESGNFFCQRNCIGPGADSRLKVELRANQFAAELLMPKFIF